MMARKKYSFNIACVILIQYYFIIKMSFAENCSPSSCGNIHNISYPFRLKHDPQHCGDSVLYEILCENNNTTASLYIDSYKYHVQEINYGNHTIRLSDPSIQHNNTCSFPVFSTYPSYSYPYSFISYESVTLSRAITFLSCPIFLNESYPFTQTDHSCNNGLININRRHIYINVGEMYLPNVRDMCSIDVVAWTSFPLLQEQENNNNVSLSQIHESLLFGFELSWYPVFCGSKCRRGACQFDGNRSWCFSISPRYVDFYIYVYLQVIKWLLELYLFLRIIIGMPIMLGLLIYKLRRRHLSMFDLIEGFLQDHNNLMPIRYSYSEIKKMTKSFREKLGQGGYGSVYKGKLRSGGAVAVKLLSKPSGNAKDFINEIATIGRIHHVNIVKLVGYCAEGANCALVYDFMPKGSLEKYILHQEKDHESLSWDNKYGIAVGVARGIEYLHLGCDIQILHFDIKPHNILLDYNFVPKISDFGLAKFVSTDKSIVTLTAARGTIGYVAPELLNRSIGGVSYKADVYSFGMLLMEMVGLKGEVPHNDHSSSQYFPDWIYNSLNKGKDIEIGQNMDDGDGDGSRKIAMKMTIVALWCIQMSPSDRPSMKQVLEMLETEDEALLRVPPQPCHLPQEVALNDQDQTWGTDSTTDSIVLLCGDASTDH